MNAAPCFVVVTGQRAALLRHLLMGEIMQSKLQILLVNQKTGTAKKTGNAYDIREAHCILFNDDNTPGAVGVLNVPKNLLDKAVPGLYTASFGLEAPTFGENQGKIVAVLADLVPIRAAAPSPAPSK